VLTFRSPIPCERVFARTSTAQLKALIEGQPVYLSFDVTLQDRYKRWLAYVHWGSTFVNGVQIASGLATAAPSGRNTLHRAMFQRMQAEAKTQKVGLWAD
jgi:endonuclease YncB( thermonuclease family)